MSHGCDMGHISFLGQLVYTLALTIKDLFCLVLKARMWIKVVWSWLLPRH
jgi:hypothetical protein